MNSTFSPKLFLSCSVFLLINLFFSVNVWAQNKLEWYALQDGMSPYFDCYTASYSVMQDESIIVIGCMYGDSARITMKNETYQFSFCTFIAKIDKDGQLIFIKPLNQNTNERSFDQVRHNSYITNDNDGNIYFLGNLNGEWSFDTTSTVIDSYYKSEVLIKINSNGDILSHLNLSANQYSANIFFGKKRQLYISRTTVGYPYSCLIETIDTSLNFVSSRILSDSTYTYTITDQDSAGNFLACGQTLVNCDIDPGQNTYLSTNNYAFITLLDSALNLIRFRGFQEGEFQVTAAFNSKEEVYVCLPRETAYHSTGAFQLDPNDPQSVIPSSTSSISLFDKNFNLKWFHYSSYNSNLNSFMFITRAYPYNLKDQITKEDGLIIQARGFTSPGNCTYCNSSMIKPRPKVINIVDLDSYLILFDSSGNLMNTIPTYSTYQYQNFKILPNNCLYVHQRLMYRNINVSINTIPEILELKGDQSFLLKYKLDAYSKYTSGKLIGDLNSNTLIDSSDVPVPFHLAYLDSTMFVALSNSKGEFQIYCDTGSYALKTNNISNFNSALPHSINVQLDSLTPYSVNHKFFFTPENSILDLSATLIANSRVRPGQQTKAFIKIENRGSVSSTSRLFLKYNGAIINFINSSLTPLSINNDSICWSISTLKPFEKKIIDVEFSVSPNASLFDTTYYFTEVWPTGNSLNEYSTSNNYDTTFSIIATSFDPNDKVSSKPANIPITSLDSSLYFKYTINFQNTGNDTAFKVVIVDSLPKNADLRTFEWIGSSHKGKPELVDGHILVVSFTNILLPDSNIDELNSHGFIAYRIRPFLNLLPGDQMKNSADIFFDYNKPVKTNTTVSTFVIPQSINEINSGTNKPFIYPNPSNSTVRIIAPLNKKIIQFEFSDLQGRILLNRVLRTMDDLTLNVYSLNSGVYLLTVTYDDNLKATTKVIVE